MTVKIVKDLSGSVRQRLLNYAKAHRLAYQQVLTRYAIERLMYRISQSDQRDRFVLKGAMLFATWPGMASRPTGDLDLLGHGDPTPQAMHETFNEICQVDAPADGLVFDPTTISVEAAREEEAYRGVRIKLIATLGTARIHVQVDVGFGDSVYPDATRENFPALLEGNPPAQMLMYPVATVVAEKFEAMVRFGEINTRIKDFHDVWLISRTFSFRMADLAEALARTFTRRNTIRPLTDPLALTDAFPILPGKDALWQAFHQRSGSITRAESLQDAVTHLRQFLLPVYHAAITPGASDLEWNAQRGEWRPRG